MRDPALLAVPFFVLFIVLELVALRVLETDEDAPPAGYDRRDSAASLSMGLGSVVVNLGARTLALLGYTALYAVTPLRLDPHDWWTWVVALLLVDLLWYSYHRSSHRVRVLWADAPGPPQQRALQLHDRPAAEVEPVGGAALLGAAAAARGARPG